MRTLILAGVVGCAFVTTSCSNEVDEGNKAADSCLPCCYDNSCESDSYCSECWAPRPLCGGSEQPCCSGRSCDANLACVDNGPNLEPVCLFPCGREGQQCCTGPYGCGNGLSCDTNSLRCVSGPIETPIQDPCSSSNGSCGLCTEMTGCGYCRDDATCRSGGPMGPGCAWSWRPDECPL